MSVPRNLDELRKIRDHTERANAAAAYIAERESAIRQAREIRDTAIMRLVNSGAGIAATARECGVSISHIKFVRDRAKAKR